MLVSAFWASTNFNSRPREGANREVIHYVLSTGNFNSRPREGANHDLHFPLQEVQYFNSRPREGANNQEQAPQAKRIISIPAPARGRTGPGA